MFQRVIMNCQTMFTISTDVIGTYHKQVSDAFEVTATLGGATLHPIL